MVENDVIRDAIPYALFETELCAIGARQQGKVRDIYDGNGAYRILVATDRASAFDRVIDAIPFKGQVLNQLSAWWFEQTKEIIPNHLVAVPDPNVTVATPAEALPVEVIVRGYITGVTSTSLWTLYEQGVELPYGLDLPAGLNKNDPLPEPVITPTTKGGPGQHDERLSCAEVVDQGLVPADTWKTVCAAALALFARGQERARRAGLILVDTKYELGTVAGQVTLIDEVHTPDSSRYWVVDSYERVRGTSQEPDNFDKEYMRIWLKQQGYTGDGAPPRLPDAVKIELARRYIAAFERLTGQSFVPGAQPAAERIEANVRQWLSER